MSVSPLEKVRRCELLILARGRQFGSFLESETSGLEFEPCYLLVLWAWACCFTSLLSLSFLICKIGEITPYRVMVRSK